MSEESVTADSKGLMGALSPLLCISFELHKIGAIGEVAEAGLATPREEHSG